MTVTGDDQVPQTDVVRVRWPICEISGSQCLERVGRTAILHRLLYPRNWQTEVIETSNFGSPVTTKYHKRVWSESRGPLFCEISGSRRVWNVLE